MSNLPDFVHKNDENFLGTYLTTIGVVASLIWSMWSAAPLELELLSVGSLEHSAMQRGRIAGWSPGPGSPQATASPQRRCALRQKDERRYRRAGPFIRQYLSLLNARAY